MKERYHTLFQNLSANPAPAGLKVAILMRIQEEERRLARRKVLVATPVTALSLAGLIWGSVYAVSALSQTGFADYLSLLFSDTTSVAQVWQPFVFSIVESLPYFALTVVVGAALVFICSTAITIHNARRAFLFA